jgi:hypothetical protein
VKYRLSVLIGGCTLLWIVAAYPLRRLGDDRLLVLSGVALLLCLVPSAITLAWATWAARRSTEAQLLLLLGGTGLRMGVALAAGLVLYLGVDYFADRRFWLCLLIAYLGTLGLEMVLLAT